VLIEEETLEQIAEWLEKLGMAEYAHKFAENRIDCSILRDLTDQDLKDLGVVLGDRRKILRAISELAGAASAISQIHAVTEPKLQDTAERRQVTVMFSDLVGSTALSARLDPEDLRDVISAYQKCVAKAVQRFGGFVAKYMGDGVLVYFGYPMAHEDDAERAVRAGLELVVAISALKTHEPLQTRVGIATGLVVVGDLIGTGASQEQAIVGETPNLAARLQGIAGPNEIVLAESTRKLIGNLFDLEDLGAQDLKGIAGPVHAWAAVRGASVEGRFDAFHAGGLTEIIGREEELDLLLRRWARAKMGEGQVVLLSGEAGIGKSRLTAAVLERLATEPHTRLRYFCSPQHTDSALYPIIGQMERAAGLAHDDRRQAKLDKLDALLAQSFTPHQHAALFAEMLSLNNDGRYPLLELAPQQRRQRTLEALTEQIVALSREKPVLMILEDVHWIDPTSLEAFGRAIERITTLCGLIIITYRPDFEPPWIGRPHVTALTVNRLGQREIAAMIDGVSGNTPLPASVRLDIIERTDGIPLFVEEITKAALEAKGQQGAERAVAAIPTPSGVPASLHASLMARLDRLGSAKEVAQIGSAIGRGFSHPLLASVVADPEAKLQSALDRLMTAGLLFRQGVPPHATYLFKHALVQDAAYGTLLREPRRALHGRIVEIIETQFTDIAENQPEVLARHCTEAGLIEKAAGLWGKAGQRSLERSALVEAAEQLKRALTQIATLPGTPTRRREQIHLQVALANALMHTKGYAAPEPKAAIKQARLFIEDAEALGEPSDDPLLLFSVLWGSWVANFVAFNADVFLDLSADFLALAEEKRASVPLMVGHHIVATSLLSIGEIADARSHYDTAFALYNPREHRPLATRFGQNVGVAMQSFRSLALCSLGYFDAAQADNAHALREAREIGHATNLMYALSFGSSTQIHRGNYATAKTFSDELIVLADQRGALLWKTYGMLWRGCTLIMAGNAKDAVQTITSGLTAYRSTGAALWLPLFLSYLTISYTALGQFDDAWRSVDEANRVIGRTKEKWFEAEVHRIAGELALKSPEPEAAKAEAYFERSLAVARHQQAKSWELRASTSLARLWRDQGKPQQARDLLAPVYGWFTEGFDTGDLKEAKALLEGLAS
jgi:class 3 adenylate cyclase/predicted ATPase